MGVSSTDERTVSPSMLLELVRSLAAIALLFLGLTLCGSMLRCIGALQ